MKRSRTGTKPGTPCIPLFAPSDKCTDLSPEQNQALDLVRHGKSVFVTGRAGCGKSRFLTALIDHLTASGTDFMATGSTGLAADAFPGGTTLHFATALDERLEPDEALKRGVRVAGTRLRAVHVLIIDEISMLSAETLGAALDIVRAARVRNTGWPLPVLVLSGDFMQLPPVSGSRLLASELWHKLALHVVRMTTSFRQAEDVEWLRLLDEARFGALSPESLAVLQARVGASVPSAIVPTRMYARNMDVDSENALELAKLPGAPVLYVARVYHAVKDDVTDEFIDAPGCAKACTYGPPPELARADTWLPPQLSDWQHAARVMKNSNTPAVLHLACGAQVMFTRNVSALGVRNGTRGVVVGFDEDEPHTPQVQLKTGRIVAAAPYCRIDYLNQDPRHVLVVKQVPLRLAWALTIHKAQGMTLDSVVIDLGPSVRTEGQAYTALSRAVSLDSVLLTAFDPKSIVADSVAADFYRS